MSARRLRVVVLGLTVTVLLAARLTWRGMRRDRTPTPWAIPVRIDLNRARLAELTALAGVGRTRAAAIVLHRLRQGPFRSVAELAAVDGLGPQTVRRLAPFVDVAEDRRAIAARSRAAAAGVGSGVR